MPATRPIADIKVGQRDREDLGNLDELAESIKAVGLLHPVVVNDDLHLIAGDRRLAAVRKLGWSEVPVTIVDLSTVADVLRAEADENTCRKELTPLEAGKARTRRRELLAPKAAERMKSGVKSEAPPCGNLPQGQPPGRTRDAAAIGTGYSGRTLDKVDEVVRIAETGKATIGTGKARKTIDVPEAVRDVARAQLPKLARTDREGISPHGASAEVREALAKYTADDPDVATAKAVAELSKALNQTGKLLPDLDAEALAPLLNEHHWRIAENVRDEMAAWFARLFAAKEAANAPVLALVRK